MISLIRGAHPFAMRRFESECSSPSQQISNFQLAIERSPAAITVAIRPIFAQCAVAVASVIVFSARAARVPSAGLGSSLSTRAKKIVEAPPDGAAAGDKKEREAVKDRALTGIQYRPKTLGKMILKISDGHLAADDEGRVAGEQPNRDQDAAEKFDHPGEPVLRRKLRHRSGPVQATEDAEQFSRPIAGKRQSHENPHQGIEIVRVPPEKSLHDHSPP